METFISILFPLVWVLTCLIGALGARLTQTAWPRAVLVASMMAATWAVCGGSPGAQVGLAILAGVVAFVALDLYGLRSAARGVLKSKVEGSETGLTSQAKATQSSRGAHAGQSATSSDAPATVFPRARPSQPGPRPGANSAEAPKATAGKLWGPVSRHERRESARERAPNEPASAGPAKSSARKSSEHFRPQAEPRAQTQGAVEIIMPAERAVLRRRSQGRGYWIARTSSGDVEVYLPPGAEAYPGRPVSIVVKPNGTLLGVPIVGTH
jgi:hypothetical protein